LLLKQEHCFAHFDNPNPCLSIAIASIQIEIIEENIRIVPRIAKNSSNKTGRMVRSQAGAQDQHEIGK